MFTFTLVQILLYFVLFWIKFYFFITYFFSGWRRNNTWFSCIWTRRYVKLRGKKVVWPFQFTEKPWNFWWLSFFLFGPIIIVLWLIHAYLAFWLGGRGGGGKSGYTRDFHFSSWNMWHVGHRDHSNDPVFIVLLYG